MGKVEIKKGIIAFLVDEQYMKNMTHGLIEIILIFHSELTPHLALYFYIYINNFDTLNFLLLNRAHQLKEIFCILSFIKIVPRI